MSWQLLVGVAGPTIRRIVGIAHGVATFSLLSITYCMKYCHVVGSTLANHFCCCLLILDTVTVSRCYCMH